MRERNGHPRLATSCMSGCKRARSRPSARRAEVFRSIIRRELEFFDEEEVGTLTSRLGADCQSIARLIGFHINVMLRNFMQCIGAPPPRPSTRPTETATCPSATLSACIPGVCSPVPSVHCRLQRIDAAEALRCPAHTFRHSIALSLACQPLSRSPANCSTARAVSFSPSIVNSRANKL